MRNLVERWQPVACGLCEGCYLGRVIAEASHAPWRLPWLLLLVLTTNAVGLALVYLASRKRIPYTPLLILAVYVFFPRVAPQVALGVLLVAIVAILVSATRGGAESGRAWWPEALVGGSTLALYVHTLAPSILPADSGEFQLVAQVLGIAHPPGYPLYTLLGKLATLIPLKDAAYRVNLLSAIIAGLAMALTNRLVRRMTGSMLIGFAVSLALVAAPTFWAQGPRPIFVV